MSLIKHRSNLSDSALLPWLPFGPPRFVDDIVHDLAGRHLIKVEEFTKDGTLTVKAEMPGLDPEEDIEVSVESGHLIIAAERHEEEEVESTERDFHRREFHYGSFARLIDLPEGVKPEDVTASYRNGILEVAVPLPDGMAKPTRHHVSIAA